MTSAAAGPWVVKMKLPGVGSKPVSVRVPLPVTVRFSNVDGGTAGVKAKPGTLVVVSVVVMAPSVPE